ncbi:MAG: sporulation protein YabP [Oscillospiraceae bacterium]|nr:sporulation protein YabP [Oscillospiraceae bacterium]
MTYDTLPHHLTLDGREKLMLSGVDHVERFDENEIVLHTSLGQLTVTGENLHIDRLSLDGGEMAVSGTVASLIYEETDSRDRGFFSRLFT